MSLWNLARKQKIFLGNLIFIRCPGITDAGFEEISDNWNRLTSVKDIYFAFLG